MLRTELTHIRRAGDTRPHGNGVRAAHATLGSSDVPPALGSDGLGLSALGGGGFGCHGAGSAAAEGSVDELEYDGARGAVPSVAPRDGDTRPHSHGVREALATLGLADVSSPSTSISHGRVQAAVRALRTGQ